MTKKARRHPVHPDMGTTARRPRQLDGSRSGGCPRHHLRLKIAGQGITEHRLLQPQGMLLNSLRDRLLHGPRLPQEAQRKNREVHPLGNRSTSTLGRVDLICIPIGHAGTTPNDTVSNITTALAKVRPSIANSRKRIGRKTPEIRKTALLHGTHMVETLLDELCSLAQTRLLGVIAHKQNK